MLDAERLLQLMLTKPSVVTKPDASELVITRGEVAFEKVTFGYDPRRGAIKDMSFQAPGGKITALVGATGGGKSTCLKLLFRFYDVSSGSITIDGQDIRDVTLSSLREQIGVVPQVGMGMYFIWNYLLTLCRTRIRGFSMRQLWIT